MRLIDADKALKIAESYGTAHGTILGRHSGVADIIHYEIAKLPTIEVESVRHGEWIESESSYSATEVVYNCSLCGNEFIVQRCDKIDFNYCPNCGAKMSVKPLGELE